LGSSLDRQVVHPIQFRMRQWMGKDPKLDPRIRIYGLGDSSIEYLQTTELGLSRWASLLEYLEQRGASAVFVDKVFGMPGELEKAPEFVQRIQALKIPVVVGAFTSPHQIPSRYPLELPTMELPQWVRHSPAVAYGPHPSIRSAFRIGHILYDGDFQYDLIRAVGPEKALVLGPLMVFDTLAVAPRGVAVAGEWIPHDGNGKVFVNSASPASYFGKTYSFASAFKAIDASETGTRFPEGTVVVLIANMFTGNTDMVTSPLGIMPGGFLAAAVINSALSKQWISQAPFQWLLLLLAGIAGIWVGANLRGGRFWLTCIGGTAAIALGGMGLFCYASHLTPWFTSGLTYAAVGISRFAIRMRRVEKNLRLTKDFLDGLVPHDKLQQLLKSSSINLDPTERVVTVLFVDVVGFSMVAEKISPQQAFNYLRTTISQIIEVVHSHGGIVDKILGDGAMCFFGYAYDGKESTVTHAAQAIQCAVAMQQRAIQEAQRAALAGEPVFPIRIGINTAAAQVGNLGTGKKIELTIIGQGVNLCKRLEAAADPFGILVGAPTAELVSPEMQLGAELTPRHIPVKHYRKPLLAYECRPLFIDEAKKRSVLECFRKQSAAERYETRWTIPEARLIEVNTSLGNGTVVDFSFSGLGLMLDHFHARGVELNLEFVDESLRRECDKASLSPLHATVSWATERGEGIFRTGVLLTNINEKQKEKLSTILQHWLEQRRAKTVAQIAR
ncbi:MAG: adenylate/guanylate cyclase domain-containing protein, partial [Bdellovibrionales bacterium]|nr:adenylate/guanylate cyclase domain-containing protein [Bdellovibrionales bacterium]